MPVLALLWTSPVVGWSILMRHDESHQHDPWDVDFLSSGSHSGTYLPGVSLQSPLQSHRDEVLGRDFLVCYPRSGVPVSFFRCQYGRPNYFL